MRAWLLLAIAGCGGKAFDGDCSLNGSEWSCSTFSEDNVAPRALEPCLFGNVAAGALCTQAECFTCIGTTGVDWVCSSSSYNPGQTPTWEAAGMYLCKP